MPGDVQKDSLSPLKSANSATILYALSAKWLTHVAPTTYNEPIMGNRAPMCRVSGFTIKEGVRMRTYDKLIATICAGQGTGSLRSSFGMALAPRMMAVPRTDAPAQEIS